MNEKERDQMKETCANIGLSIVVAAYQQVNGHPPESVADLFNGAAIKPPHVEQSALNLAKKMRTIILGLDLPAMSRPPEQIVNELYSLSTQVKSLHETIAQLRSSPEYTMGCALLTFARIMKQQ